MASIFFRPENLWCSIVEWSEWLKLACIWRSCRGFFTLIKYPLTNQYWLIAWFTLLNGAPFLILVRFRTRINFVFTNMKWPKGIKIDTDQKLLVLHSNILKKFFLYCQSELQSFEGCFTNVDDDVDFQKVLHHQKWCITFLPRNAFVEFAKTTRISIERGYHIPTQVWEIKRFSLKELFKLSNKDPKDFLGSMGMTWIHFLIPETKQWAQTGCWAP